MQRSSLSSAARAARRSAYSRAASTSWTLHGPDDDEQAVVGAVEHRADLVAAAQHHLGLLVGQRQLLEQLRRGDDRHGPLDAQVANLL